MYAALSMLQFMQQLSSKTKLTIYYWNMMKLLDFMKLSVYLHEAYNCSTFFHHLYPS